jgi:hypothetical protein
VRRFDAVFTMQIDNVCDRHGSGGCGSSFGYGMGFLAETLLQESS